MNRLRLILTCILTIAAVCLLLPVCGHALDLPSITQQAQQAASAGKTTRALGLYELALTQSVGQADSVFGPIEGQYWRLIAKTGDFPRAFYFFTALAAEQKSPDATLLASKADASGGYLGWLQTQGLMASLPPSYIHQLNARALGEYNRALALEPNNFGVLYGYAIYESYAPNGKARMQQLLAKLNSLRASHPHYPWSMVDYLEQHGHPQQ